MRVSFLSHRQRTALVLFSVVFFLSLAGVAYWKTRHTPQPALAPTPATDTVQSDTFTIEIPAEWPTSSPPGAEDRFSVRLPPDARITEVAANQWEVRPASGSGSVVIWLATDLEAASTAVAQAQERAPAQTSPESGPWMLHSESAWVIAQRLDEPSAPQEWIDFVLASLTLTESPAAGN